MPFLDDDFLLGTATARSLYHGVAAGCPIYDYHCHLSPGDLSRNRRFANLYEIWLEGDHYKWRAMRANGVGEEFCTGSADPWEKFLAWARTVPRTLRNPLYHWTHLELRRVFGIDLLLGEATAREVWDEANRQLATLDAWEILRRFDVAVVCTTDDPADGLEEHAALAGAPLETRVYPAFRPDAALRVEDPAAFVAYADRLGGLAGCDTGALGGFLDALRARADFFHARGCRLSDHGLTHLPDAGCDAAAAGEIYARARRGEIAGAAERDAFVAYLSAFFGRLAAERDWTMQLHLGALRNCRGAMFERRGRDIGFDGIGDFPQGPGLRRLLDALDREGMLPRTILYNLNPADNYLFACMAGSFQDGSVPGKMQWGSGWWFLDQEEGIRWQLNALSQVGLLSRFVGMLTDSRSFLSYPRHEYFRRVLCDEIGRDVERGALPDDAALLGELVRGICFENARRHFGLALGARHAEPA